MVLNDEEIKKKQNMKEAIEGELNRDEDVSGLESFYVKIDAFEGPFDLLLHLIDEDRIDIYTVSLKQITKEYLDYIKLMKELDISVASDFLLMAAYLIEMKSKMLLPVEERPSEDLESREEIEKTLLERIFEYKIFKGLAEHLKERKQVFEKAYPRHVDPDVEFDEGERNVFLVDVTLRDLVLAFQKVWDVVEARGGTQEIPDEHITVSEKIKEILGELKRQKQGIAFESLFTKLTVLEVIVTFLAILELARQKLVSIKQGQKFSSILIFAKES